MTSPELMAMETYLLNVPDTRVLMHAGVELVQPPPPKTPVGAFDPIAFPASGTGSGSSGGSAAASAVIIDPKLKQTTAFGPTVSSGSARMTSIRRTSASGAGTFAGTATEIRTTPPPPSGTLWQPTQLSFGYTRPTGPGFVTWESIVGTAAAAAQANTPNTPTPLTQALLANSAAANKVITLPKGVFTLPAGYPATNGYALAFGQGYGNTCRGLAGSGAGGIQGSATETIIKHAAVATTNGTLMRFNYTNDPYIGGISFRGVQTRGDGVYQGGIVFAHCTGHPVLEWCYFRGFSPGYAQSPPGETFGISMFYSPNATVRDTEVDGRDAAGNRTSASPVGWNTVVNDDPSVVHVQRVYVHHGIASMLTFWETTNITTEDFYSYSWASGTGSLSGSGINHEQSGGRIRHYRPRLFINNTRSAGPVGPSAYGHPPDDATKQPSTSSETFSVQSGLTDATADFEMWYPQWDNTLGNSGVLCMSSYDGYSLGQACVSTPKIYLRNAGNTADYLLTRFDHPNSGWQNKDPLTYFVWIH